MQAPVKFITKISSAFSVSSSWNLIRIFSPCNFNHVLSQGQSFVWSIQTATGCRAARPTFYIALRWIWHYRSGPFVVHSFTLSQSRHPDSSSGRNIVASYPLVILLRFVQVLFTNTFRNAIFRFIFFVLVSGSSFRICPCRCNWSTAILGWCNSWDIAIVPPGAQYNTDCHTRWYHSNFFPDRPSWRHRNQALRRNIHPERLLCAHSVRGIEYERRYLGRKCQRVQVCSTLWNDLSVLMRLWQPWALDQSTRNCPCTNASWVGKCHVLLTWPALVPRLEVFHPWDESIHLSRSAAFRLYSHRGHP